MTVQSTGSSPWHLTSPDEAARRLQVDPALGLTAAEADRRRAEHGPNALPTEPVPSANRPPPLFAGYTPGAEPSVMVRSDKVTLPLVAVAGILVARRCRERAWLYGAAAGLIYSAFAFVIFSILSDTFVLSLAALADLGIGVLAGTLSAMIFKAAK